MGFPFNITNPGILIPGLLTAAEQEFVTDLFTLPYATGDILYYNGTDLTRRAIGSPNQVLTVTGGVPVWATPTAGFADPLTTNGDIIARVGGTTTRLAQGGNGSFLGVSGGVLGYYTPTGIGDVVGPASAVNNRVVFFDGATGKLIKDSGLTLSGSNTGDQTSIVGISGTFAQFNTAVSDADLARTDAANTFTGIQTFSTPIAATSLATMTATVGGAVPTPPNNTTTFLRGDGVFAAPSSGFADPLTTNGDIIARIAGATTRLAQGADGTFLGVSGGTLGYYTPAGGGYTDEQAQDAVGAMVDASLTYVDATPLLQRAALTGAITASAGSNTTALGSFTKAQLDTAVSDGNVLYVGDVTTNATHTGEVTGSGALTVDKTAITNKSTVTADGADYILLSDTSDSGNLKKALVSDVGGTSNTFNDIYIDQAGGTSDTYGVLGGARNGSNTVYTVSEAVYGTGTLKVWKNGQLLTQGSSEDFVETSPAAGTFTMAVAPTSGDEITAEYQKIVVNSGSLLTGSSYTPKLYVYLPDYKPQTEIDTFITNEVGVNGKFWAVFWENYRFDGAGAPIFVDTTVSGGSNMGFSSGNKTRVQNIADNVIVTVAGDVTGGVGVMLANGTLRANAISAIVSHVSSEGFQGVNINFEPIASITAGTVLNNFTSFMVALKAALVAVSPDLILTWAGQISWDSDQPNKEYSSVNYTGESNMSGTNLLAFTLTDIEAMGTDIVEMQAYDQFYDFGLVEFGVTSPDQVANAIGFAHSRLPKSKYGLIIGTYAVQMNSGADEYGENIAPNNMTRAQVTSADATFYTTATRQNNQYLLKQIDTTIGTATITIASPGVISRTAHGMSVGQTISFTTTGALPTGIVAGTTYYIISAGFGANSFRISATDAGAAINTTGTQSGTHTLYKRNNIIAPDQRTIDTYYAICKNREVAYIGFWLCGDYYYPSVR